MDRLPLPARTAYAELLELLLAFEASRSIGHAKGSIVTKKIKERDYHYFQYSAPGGKVEQRYLGPRTAALDAVVKRFETEREAVAVERDHIVAVAAVVRAGRAGVTDGPSARVVSALAEAGVFRLGGVLVGTQAFVVLGNVLGVTWTGLHLRTDDVDIGATRHLHIAVPDLAADVPKALDDLETGFLPVPRFDPKAPSTSFKVRGRGLRVDLLTPASSSVGAKPPSAVPIPRLNAAATPLRYLDYVLDDAQPAALVNGGAVLVNVPSPARFALHKLLVATDRPSAAHSKVDKDLAQAAALVDVLEEDRPGDLAAAWKALRGRGWAKSVRDAAAQLKKRWPASYDRLAPILK